MTDDVRAAPARAVGNAVYLDFDGHEEAAFGMQSADSAAFVAGQINRVVAAERERCAQVATQEIWQANEREEKAISKGCAEYTRIFRTASLAENVAAAIRWDGADSAGEPK